MDGTEVTLCVDHLYAGDWQWTLRFDIANNEKQLRPISGDGMRKPTRIEAIRVGRAWCRKWLSPTITIVEDFDDAT